MSERTAGGISEIVLWKPMNCGYRGCGKHLEAGLAILFPDTGLTHEGECTVGYAAALMIRNNSGVTPTPVYVRYDHVPGCACPAL